MMMRAVRISAAGAATGGGGGGTVSSPALTLLVIPALFKMFRPAVSEVSAPNIHASDLLR
jgi:hypothetical protein